MSDKPLVHGESLTDESERRGVKRFQAGRILPPGGGRHPGRFVLLYAKMGFNHHEDRRVGGGP